jgi:DNA-3-methyladenine glycosylase I
MAEPLPSDGVRACEDGVIRCAWACATPDYHAYHDAEWGFPVSSDARLFEKLSLEGFQAGLSWLTILRKREAFRAAFAGFDHDPIERFSSRDVTRLLADAGIVRHRGKIEAVINNAKRAVELVEAEGSIGHYVWGFEPASPAREPDARGQLPASTPESIALAKDLKRRGWKFVVPTTVYAFMQAMGLVNDHREGCDACDRAARARKRFASP